jgi:hypothetical protein
VENNWLREWLIAFAAAIDDRQCDLDSRLNLDSMIALADEMMKDADG